MTHDVVFYNLDVQTRLKLSQAMEDYLKTIFDLQRKQSPVSTNAIAERLGFAPASVTGMIKKLAKYDPALVNYERHYGVTLTDAGEKVALEVLRHHRLIELYLTEALGYSWDEVHAEAERLEHVISEDFEDRIANFLGNPTHDPHGEPIPTKAGVIAEAIGQRLSALDIGQNGAVVRVDDNNPEMLRYLTKIGIERGTHLTIADIGPFDGPVHVTTQDGETHALGRKLANSVYLKLIVDS